MSRGGRGGFRGGGAAGRIGGADVPWAVDPDVKPDYTPSQMFPVSDTSFRSRFSTGSMLCEPTLHNVQCDIW
jgi:hypothetical protein